MSVVVVTGSCGLIGSESVSHFADQGCDIIGIDNDLRRAFFGDQSSTASFRKPSSGGIVVTNISRSTFETGMGSNRCSRGSAATLRS